MDKGFINTVYLWVILEPCMNFYRLVKEVWVDLGASRFMLCWRWCTNQTCSFVFLPIPCLLLTGQPKVQCLHSGILLSSPQALGVGRWREMQPLIFPSLDELVWSYSLDVKVLEDVGSTQILTLCVCMYLFVFVQRRSSVFFHIMNLMGRLWRWARFRLKGLSLALGWTPQHHLPVLFVHLEGFDASKVESFHVQLSWGRCLQDSWHLQPQGVQSELGSHHLSLQSMMDVYEEAISSLRHQAEKATESLLKNGTLDKSQKKSVLNARALKDPESFGMTDFLNTVHA